MHAGLLQSSSIEIKVYSAHTAVFAPGRCNKGSCISVYLSVRFLTLGHAFATRCFSPSVYTMGIRAQT